MADLEDSLKMKLLVFGSLVVLSSVNSLWAQQNYASPCGFSIRLPEGARVGDAPGPANQCGVNVTTPSMQISILIVADGSDVNQELSKFKGTSVQNMAATDGRLMSEEGSQPSIVGALIGKSEALQFRRGDQGTSVWIGVFPLTQGDNFVMLLLSSPQNLYSGIKTALSMGGSAQFQARAISTDRLVGSWLSNSITQTSMSGLALPARTFQTSLDLKSDGSYDCWTSVIGLDPKLVKVNGTYTLSSSSSGKVMLTLSPTKSSNDDVPERKRLSYEGFPGMSTEMFALDLKGNTVEIERYDGGVNSGKSLFLKKE